MLFKLRNKVIILLVGIALVPLFFVMVVTVTRLRDIQQENAILHSWHSVELTTEKIETFILLQFGVLDDINMLFSDFFFDPKAQSALLERVLFSNDNFYDIAIVDVDGKEISRRNQLLSITSEDLVDRKQSKEFLEVRNAGRYIGPLFIERGTPFFIIGRVLLDVHNNFQGAIFAKVDARTMQDVVREISPVDSDVRVYIVDQNGTVVAHPDISQVLLEKNFSFIPIVSGLVETQKTFIPTSSYLNELNEEMFGVAIPISLSFKNAPKMSINTGWFVIAERSVSFAFAIVQQTTRFILYFLFVVLALSIAVGFTFARRIVAPIEKLHHASQEFARGRLKYRVTIKTNDEIEDLAKGFNEMAEKLSKSIFDLKKERGALRAEKNKLTRVLEGIIDAVIAVDVNRNIIIFNKAAVSMTEVSEHKAMGKPIDSIVTFFADGKELSVSQYCPINNKKTSGITFSKNTLQMRGLKKEERYVNLVAGQIKGGESINLGCILTLHDVTREWAIEKMKSEFVAIAAHQLRTPLSIVKWSLQMFKDKIVKKNMPKELTDLLDKVYITNERMIHLVANLLNTARIEEGKSLYKPVPADIQEIIESVLELHRVEIKRKNLKLTFIKPKERLPKIQVDTEAVKLAVGNIVGNSRKYTVSGGSIEISLRSMNSDIEVYVRDTGIGIPANQQYRVFTKFFRAGNAIRMETEGSGLGLFIAKNIIEAHDGKIWFESEENKGSTFYFTIPIKKKN